jgi:glycine/D-amino acid oxidase-like deaminating enzyme/nitrite reductase/ring-hydroxylating ferredoxin subunit
MSKVASHSPASLWKIGEWPNFAEQVPHKSNDVCIVGAGIAGLTCAYLMAMEGLRVTVLEASMPGDGETGNTSAHLSSALDDRFTELEELFGVDGSFLAAESHRWAIDIIESICLRENIDCDFERVDGFLFTTETTEIEELRKEFEAAQRAGFADLEFLHAPPLSSRRQGAAIRFPNQGQFHPLKYLKGLAAAVQKYGGQILPNHEVIDIHGHAAPYTLTTRQGTTHSASHVVIATNTPFNNRFVMHTKQAAYRTYILTFAIEAGRLNKALYWDMKDPYHYVRLYQPNEHQTLLIVGGEDHKTGQSEDPDRSFAQLETWARANFPEAGDVVTRWSGQVMEPVDSLAFIGRNPGDEGIYIATGDSGHGLTHGTIAGMLLNDLVHNRSNPWEKLYDPARKARSFTSLKEFFKENINVALQYRDYFSPADLSRPSEVSMGEGAIVRHGLQKLAVYRDHENELHMMSAVCPHLGGIVRWNKVEKTWDCPCHGSRFSCKGEVINGPAMSNLSKAEMH